MTNEELQQLQTVIQATVNAAVAPLATRLEQLEQGQKSLATKQDIETIRSEVKATEQTLHKEIQASEKRLTKRLDGLEQLAADYQDREIRKLTRRVAIIEKQLQISPE